MAIALHEKSPIGSNNLPSASLYLVMFSEVRRCVNRDSCHHVKSWFYHRFIKWWSDAGFVELFTSDTTDTASKGEKKGFSLVLSNTSPYESTEGLTQGPRFPTTSTLHEPPGICFRLQYFVKVTDRRRTVNPGQPKRT